MSMFDLKGGSSGNGWNYSDNTKQNYMETIEGTVVEVSNPQSVNFGTKQPEFWPDGNPKRNLRMVIKGRSGQELSWTFQPKGKATEAILAALDPQGTKTQVSIEELLGKFIRVQTQGGVYNAQNPRPWWVTILGEGDAGSVRGLIDLSQPNRAQAAPVQQMPAPVVAPQQPPAPQVSAAPTALQVAQDRAAQALGFQQNAQPNAAPVNQVPANQVPYEEVSGGGYYDSDIPF